MEDPPSLSLFRVICIVQYGSEAGEKGGSWLEVVCMVLDYGFCVLNLCSELSCKGSH